jgi:hypothetical protein
MQQTLYSPFVGVWETLAHGPQLREEASESLPTAPNSPAKADVELLSSLGATLREL